MDDRAQVRIVEIEDIAAGRIEKGGAQRIDLLASADDGRLPAFGEHHKRGECLLDRILTAAGQCGGDEVQDRSLAFVPHRVRELLPAGAADEGAERLRDVRWSCHAVSVRSCTRKWTYIDVKPPSTNSSEPVTY